MPFYDLSYSLVSFFTLYQAINKKKNSAILKRSMFLVKRPIKSGLPGNSSAKSMTELIANNIKFIQNSLLLVALANLVVNKNKNTVANKWANTPMYKIVLALETKDLIEALCVPKILKKYNRKHIYTCSQLLLLLL